MFSGGFQLEFLLITLALSVIAIAAANVRRSRREMKVQADAARDRLARLDSLFAQTREFFARIEAYGALPSLAVYSLILQTGEFAVLYHAETVMAGYKRET